MNELRKPALRIALLVASLAAWESAVRLLRIPSFVLPTPSQVGAALYRGAASGIYLQHFWITLAETLLGFGSHHRTVQLLDLVDRLPLEHVSHPKGGGLGGCFIVHGGSP